MFVFLMPLDVGSVMLKILLSKYPLKEITIYYTKLDLD